MDLCNLPKVHLTIGALFCSLPSHTNQRLIVIVNDIQFEVPRPNLSTGLIHQSLKCVRVDFLFSLNVSKSTEI